MENVSDSLVGMATLIKRLKDPLLYLDQVRQHLARLPDINPNTRTMLVAGFPNVGKSSFVRSVTRADTPVEPYAFVGVCCYIFTVMVLTCNRQRRACSSDISTTNVRAGRCLLSLLRRLNFKRVTDLRYQVIDTPGM